MGLFDVGAARTADFAQLSGLSRSVGTPSNRPLRRVPLWRRLKAAIHSERG